MLDTIAGALPLRPVVRLVVAATAPTAQPIDPAELLVVLAWLVVGAAVVAWRFDWAPREAGPARAGTRPARAS